MTFKASSIWNQFSQLLQTWFQIEYGYTRIFWNIFYLSVTKYKWLHLLTAAKSRFHASREEKPRPHSWQQRKWWRKYVSSMLAPRKISSNKYWGTSDCSFHTANVLPKTGHFALCTSPEAAFDHSHMKFPNTRKNRCTQPLLLWAPYKM